MKGKFSVVITALAASGLVAASVTTGQSFAHAEAAAYLVNVTVRPGYNFRNADEALAYGHGLCDRIAGGHIYAEVIGDIKNDFNTVDEFQASYLISQAANELCPPLIWQVRNSAAGYRPGAAA